MNLCCPMSSQYPNRPLAENPFRFLSVFGDHPHFLVGSSVDWVAGFDCIRDWGEELSC